MSEDRQDHEAKADELERELDDMQGRTENLGGEIEDAGDEWKRRKADERVPSAADEPDEDEDDGGVEPGDGEELDFGRSLADDGDDDEG